MTVETLVAIAAIGVPVMGAIIVIAWRGGSRIQQLIDGQRGFDRRLKRIEVEVSYNAGTSLKDRVEAVITLEQKVLRKLEEISQQ